jgi:hypothetical protein
MQREGYGGTILMDANGSDQGGNNNQGHFQFQKVLLRSRQGDAMNASRRLSVLSCIVLINLAATTGAQSRAQGARAQITAACRSAGFIQGGAVPSMRQPM